MPKKRRDIFLIKKGEGLKERARSRLRLFLRRCLLDFFFLICDIYKFTREKDTEEATAVATVTTAVIN